MIVHGRNELDFELRKYKLDDLLFLLAKTSQEMYKKRIFLEKCAWNRRIGQFPETFEQLMPVWGLAELSYRAKGCNYRSSRNFLFLLPFLFYVS